MAWSRWYDRDERTFSSLFMSIGWKLVEVSDGSDGDGDRWPIAVADGRIVDACGIWDFCSVSSGIVDVYSNKNTEKQAGLAVAGSGYWWWLFTLYFLH